jgi:hypothetical protein
MGDLPTIDPGNSRSRMSPDEHRRPSTRPAFDAPNPVPVDPPVEPAPVEGPTARLRGMVADHYDAAQRRPTSSGVDVDELEAPLPSPEELLDQKRARSALQSVLSAMTPDLRLVFVLFEIEELTLPEIAAATGAPLGTVTSRLRRAREQFQSIVKRRNAAPRPPAREGGP